VLWQTKSAVFVYEMMGGTETIYLYTLFGSMEGKAQLCGEKDRRM